MKSQAFWIPNTPFPSRYREQILELIAGDVEILKRLESAANLYYIESTRETEKPKQINQDAKDLADAIKTINRIVSENGTAMTWFKNHGGRLARDFADCFFGANGECLAIAAHQTIDDTKPVGGRPAESDRAARLGFILCIADSVRELGIAPSRTSDDFPELIRRVYSATGIDPEYADRDIRQFIETKP